VSGGTLVTPEAGNTVITGPSGVISINLASTTTSTTFRLVGAAASTTYYVTTQMVRSGQSPITKTLAPEFTLSAVTPALTIDLTKCDVYKINSIIDASGNDWTNDFLFDNGQTDYYYGKGSLIFNGTTLPGSNLTIKFTYFTWSSGDYMVADSYKSMSTGYDHLPMIPSFRSKTTNLTYKLQNYIDFRPRIGETTQYNNTVVPGSATTSSVQYYVPRIDVIYINTSKVIDAVVGEPDDVPLAKNVPSGTLKLYTVNVPAYTTTIDSILITPEKNKRYTMRDIGKLEDRIANVEYFSTLNSVEQSLLSFEVPDAVTGLNRFKTGYLVDNFSNPFTVCDYFNHLSGTRFRSLELTPSMEIHDSGLIIDSGLSSNYDITGDQITMPYVEEPFISQTTSTRVTNINHFLLISWEGTITLVPPIDNWIDTEYLPEIFNVVNNTVVVTRVNNVTTWEPAPAEPVQQPAPAPRTVGIAVPNSLAVQGATGQTVFQVPLEAVNMTAPGIWTLSPNITAATAVDWMINQVNSGQTQQSASGNGFGHLLLDN
jgi:hypothetical protein